MDEDRGSRTPAVLLHGLHRLLQAVQHGKTKGSSVQLQYAESRARTEDRTVSDSHTAL